MGNKPGGQQRPGKGPLEPKHTPAERHNDTKSSNESVVEATSASNSKVESVEDEIVEEKLIELSFDVELGGGKGWPPDANVVLYHHPTGLIVMGTECGALYAYGDGFQYVQPAAEQMDITHIVSAYDENILVRFADNSLSVFMIPSLTLSHHLPASWLNEACGDITTIHIDEYHPRHYAYLGTTEGYVRVLQVLPEFREVEYCITCSDAGVGGHMAVSDLQICPKDEKYLLIAYDGVDDESVGAVVVYDLAKRRSYRVYKTAGITTAAFNHNGDMLFAGTRLGDVLVLGLDKVSSVTVWNTRSEMMEDDGSDDDVRADETMIVRKMHWMPPLSPTQEGCLFVLIGSLGADMDHAKSVIVALLPSSHGDMKTIFTVPPLPNAEVVGFRLAPTWDKESSSPAAVPGLLLLTESECEDREFIRELMVMRCPVGNVSEWELEMGILPDPRPALEVLPGKAPVTFISACLPSSSLASAFTSMERSSDSVPAPAVCQPPEGSDSDDEAPGALLSSRTSTSRNSTRRLSARDFFKDVCVTLTNFETLAETAATWELTLASGERGDTDAMDVVFVGHADGSIIAWGVCLPPRNSGDCSRGNCWVPLTALKCGNAEVTYISYSGSLLICGDDSGGVVVWDTDQTSPDTKSAQERLRSTVNQSVTCAVVGGAGAELFVGTRDGAVFAKCNWDSSDLVRVNALEHIGASGSVLYMFHAPYWKDVDLQPGVYVVYASGHVAVLHSSSLEVMAVSSCVYDTDDDDDTEYGVPFACVINSKFEVITDVPKCGDGSKSKPTSVSAHDSASSTGSGGKSGAPISSAPPASSFMKKFKRNSSDTYAAPPHTKPTDPPPITAPKYVVFVQGKSMRRCEIAQFCRSTPTGLSLPGCGGVYSRPVAAAPIVTASVVSYIEDATRFWTSPLCALACVDETADMYFLSLQSGHGISRFDALPQVMTEPYNVHSAYILANGNTFIGCSGNMIFSAAPLNSEYLPTAATPSRASTMWSPPDSAQLMNVQRESESVGNKGKSKRRASFLMGSPVDLDKLFAKTYEQHQKDELFNSRKNDKVKGEEEGYKISRDEARNASSTAARTKVTLDETRQNFEERGERINRLNKKMEDFGIEAKKYKANSQAHKEKMRKNAQKWGIF
mmetsp:Transcript_6254/g.9444  ORF Transcript_6254/g.9444 Transcript_6254/m.9444 type:complete len:1136 (+) Transcript_6254:136-3543(+)|eukprot:CAMPEP_0185019786 /NCGR_PEP_ID=MMETSP1103-20130426/2368_1 /TAXON_ID=36769 /ORGANISM="Paraphysomonas bandaiensis, Strain Caron Lab Isolate" /LENGTH=1135 /DNA_ID=CAMNT_0027550267 /DNA_START=111 /DNA_END=3518 /DNA_ORIENTATION=-